MEDGAKAFLAHVEQVLPAMCRRHYEKTGTPGDFGGRLF
jgi:hypothetical protein